MNVVQISAATLAGVTGGSWVGELPPSTSRGVSTDTRTLREGDLFIPLVGEFFNGHEYLALAQNKGAWGLLSQQHTELPHLRVADTLVAYQQIARWWREQFTELVVIAVTGSAGKTTTKELIAQVLGGSFLKSAANENNDIGVARTLLQLQPHHQGVILELAMRGLGEIRRLTQIAQPTIAVITNVGSAHIGRLGSQAAIAEAKCEILEGLSPQGVAILNGEDELLLATARQRWAGQTVKFGLTSSSVLTETTLTHRGQEFQLPLPGRHNALNFLAALAVAEELGRPLTELTHLPALTLPGGRSRLIKLAHGAELLDETYNASPEAVLAALDELATYHNGRRIAVLGRMGELGAWTLPLHQQVGERVQKLALDHLLVLGDHPDMLALTAAALPTPTTVCPTLESLAQALLRLLQPGDRVLCKASRAVGLEQLFPYLI